MSGIVKLAGGVLCGCALSQFPEYSQQYVQRMGGALDELQTVVSDFDESAASTGLSREQALDALAGSDFLIARQADMRGTFARFDRLSQDYSALKGASGFGRLAKISRLRDMDVARGAFQDYKPAVPLTFEGMVFVIFGFLFGYGTSAAIMRMMRKNKDRVGA